MDYKKSQIGWFILLFLTPIITLLALAYIYQWGSNPIPFVLFVVISIIFIGLTSLFCKLTVILDGSTLKLIYGIGLIKMDFELEQLERTEIIRTPFYYGFGIRMTPQGNLYNIQGPKAVRIVYFKNGKQNSFMVGSPEPDKLKSALDKISTRDQATFLQ